MNMKSTITILLVHILPSFGAILPINVCDVTVNITNVLVLGSDVYTKTVEAKFQQNDPLPLNVKRGPYCDANGVQPVTYTIKYCNKDQYALKFDKGSCEHSGQNPPGVTNCSFAFVNGKRLYPDFTTDLAPGECRLKTEVVMQNICALPNSIVSQTYPSQIQIQGYLNGVFCRGYLFSSVFYGGSDPVINPTITPTSKPSASPTTVPTSKPSPKPTSKPSASPTSKPTSKPTARPTFKPTSKPSLRPTRKPSVNPTKYCKYRNTKYAYKCK